MKARSALLSGLCVLGYFMLADLLSPKLASAGMLWLWWLVLCGYVVGGYVLMRVIHPGRKNRGTLLRLLETAAYALVLLTLILADSHLGPLLERYHLGEAWIGSFALLAVVAAILASKSPDLSN